MRLFLLLFSILLATTCFTQYKNFNYEYIGTEEGLPYYYCNALYEDSDGYLWIGTTGGLTRYDGINNIIYTTDNGLDDNIIYSIIEDKNKNIWVGTKSGVCRITKSGKIFAYKIGKKNTFISELFISSSNVLFCASEIGLFVFNPTLNRFQKAPFFTNTEPIKTVIEKNNVIWFGGYNGLYKYNQEKNKIKLVIPTLQDTAIQCSLLDYDGRLWFGTNSGVYKQIKQDSFLLINYGKKYGNTFNKLFQAKDSTYIFPSYGGGIYFFKQDTAVEKYDLGQGEIIKNTVGDIVQTKNGTIWLATAEGLIKKTNPILDIIPLFDVEEQIYLGFIVRDNDGVFWIGTAGKGLVKYDYKLNNATLIKVGDDVLENSLTGLYYDKNNDIVYMGNIKGKLLAYQNNKVKEIHIDNFNSQPLHSIYEDRNHNLWLSKARTLFKVTKDGKSEIIKTDTISNFYYTVIEDKNGNILSATAQGIYVIKKDTITHFTELNNEKIGNVRTFCKDKNDFIWCATITNGVWKLNPDDFSAKHFTLKDGLKSNYIDAIAYDTLLNAIWCTTLKGLSCIQLDEKSNVIKIKSYNLPKYYPGLLQFMMLSIYSDSEVGLIAGSGIGLIKYNHKYDKENTNPPSVSLQNIYLFNEKFDFTPYCKKINKNNLPVDLELPYNKNYLTFEYSAVEFNCPEDIKYSVMLEGFDTKWVPMERKNSIVYSFLPYGSYKLKIRAKNNDGLWSKPVEFKFKINKPFYFTWWFILCSLGIIIFIAFYFINKKIKQINQKAEIEKNMIDLELKALRAQMNPHFIFNILNNIQNYVLNKKNIKAVELIGEFSSLIRNILDMTSEKTVTLNKEIEFLKTYINLDLTQYPNKYTYEIIVDDVIDTYNTTIPPMLIQPFVENAILHGLLHKQDKGKLIIKFCLDTEHLICEIIDDGIGIIKSKDSEKIKTKHKSRALNISEQRITEFNKQQNRIKYNIEIIDLSTVEKNKTGTKVIIKMPLNYK